MNREFEKIVVATVVLILLSLIGMVIETIPSNATTQTQYFRLLALETLAGERTARDAQRLISTLLQYDNWNNKTSQFISYIEFLSTCNESEISPECRPFWMGYSNKQNLKDRIMNFLGQARSDETVVFHYSGLGLELQLYLGQPPNYEIINASELLSWLNTIKTTTCIILDACHSGSWIDDGSGGNLGPGRLVLAGCRSNELCAVARPEDPFGVFTGVRDADYHNGTVGPVGIMRGLMPDSDLNKDSWISFSECFQFAKTSVEQYERGLQNPVSFNGLGFDPQFIQLPLEPLTAKFSYTPTIPWANESILFNASTSYSQNSNITTYTWDFGDGNITNITFPTINHSYILPGNYSLTLTVTNDAGDTNTTTANITITFISDLNKDRTVNILDITIVAAAYNTRPDDEKWNAAADLDKNEWINILDISMVARDFGKGI